ncbi:MULTISPECIES: 4-aminobutyrate--2-oxoglutarate transaminase [Paraburkholderia]|uniref:4-aminobutyrate--2-oxoglutarate transaminase n=1 Tax=Paraburkholderia madseniana TaxID=2599607 RepID=A0AAP5BJB5_9BURK|nr:MULTISPECIES: 4-aminobutyrate--2-oxoglutarate transaminase [Paraburkholderia]MCX4149764.1 4-aminobutyrate--2-oxoglutarate transaminase [Paraburkholderia madseniana]MCX4175111.1 4-aminobutyrate--2-oxoglutarate transaminase [Paraburkholderia madseniana]MDN7152700.1 4-aminobutyrate--2-oxoglutarate transaminase [Paraburkholderia sp. WS6]MDQ6411582.1 4-aminobutyrate--2-oxoglutarate transaminase [Paraburkholderia madseniana]MDQ6463111.1 4-aminobutyrate--2-oxoglutarate transaminase [Paraburkholder
MSSRELNTTSQLAAMRQTYVARGVATAHPIFAQRATGSYLWDEDGLKYLDFVGGIGVLNVGHNHPAVVAAVQQQLESFSHVCFQVVAYEPYVRLAARLSELVAPGQGYKSAFFTTGAEAVENAIKIARAYTNRPGIIAFRGGFHGRTLMGMTLTGMSAPYKQNFGPFAPDVYHAPYPNAYHGVSSDDALAALEQIFTTQIAAERVAAIILEPVQGDGGFLAAPPEFMQALRALTQRHGIVLIADEIQTGFGRTGQMFGFQHSGIQPDLVTVAKSLAGGLPLSGVVGRADMVDAPLPGGLGGTYGGNPLACAAANAVLDLFERENVIERSREIGAQLREGLLVLAEAHDEMGEVRQTGSMVAVEFVTDRRTKTPAAALVQRVLDAARDEGLLLIKCGVERNVVRFLAPLTTSAQDVTDALAMFGRAVTTAKRAA